MAILSLTYAEVAERLSVTVSGARMRVKRAGWPKVKGNDGTMRVMVDDGELTPVARSPNVRPPVREQPNEQVAEQLRTLEAMIALFKEQTVVLQEQLAKAETLANTERTRAEQEREKVTDLTVQLCRATADAMALHADMMAIQKAYQAERQRHRPWWRRLSG